MPFWSCRVQVSQNTDGVTSLHKTLIVFIDSQCNGLMRRGATRLTFSPGEQRTARCLSTYPLPLGSRISRWLLGKVAGDTTKFCKLRGCLKTVTVVLCEVHLGTTSGTRSMRNTIRDNILISSSGKRLRTNCFQFLATENSMSKAKNSPTRFSETF